MAHTRRRFFNRKKTADRIPDFRKKQPSKERRTLRYNAPFERPLFYPAAFHIPTSDDQVISGTDIRKHFRNKYRGMGEIRIHHKEDIRLSLTEAFDNGLGESMILFPDNKIEIWFCFFEIADNSYGPIRRVIIYNKNLPADSVPGKDRIHLAMMVPIFDSSLNVGIITVRSYMKKTHTSGRSEEIDPGILACETGIIFKPCKCISVRICSADILRHNKIHRAVTLL